MQDDAEFASSLQAVTEDDVTALIESRIHYGDSWRAEGGFSAWFNIKRKVDRLVKLMSRDATPTRDRYDIFGHIQSDLAEGGEAVLDAVRDMRRYLILVEAHLVQQKVKLPPSRDNVAAEKRHEAAVKQVAKALFQPRTLEELTNDMFGKQYGLEAAQLLVASQTQERLGQPPFVHQGVPFGYTDEFIPEVEMPL